MAEPRLLKNSLRYRADRMLGAARQGGLPVPMASPPAFTLSVANAATGISGATKTLLAGVDPVFSAPLQSAIGLHGVASSAWNDWSAQDLLYAGAVDIGSDTRRGGTIMFPFWCDAPVIELLLLGAVSPGNSYQLWIDGQPSALAPRSDVPADSSFRRVRVELGSAAPRLFWLQLDKYMEFGGITVGANYCVWPAAIDSPRLMLVGDSYIDGTGATAFMTGLARQVGQRLGVPDSWANGEGGLGYVKPGSLSGKNAAAKLADDVFAYEPDWVVVCLGANDVDQDAIAVRNNAAQYFAQLLAGLPYAGVTVIGPWRAPGLNPPAAIESAIGQAATAQTEAVAAKRIHYVSTYEQNWQQVAGWAGAPSGSGNSNIHVGADKVHAVQAGHDYLGARVANAVLDHLIAISAL
jgi:lysophospholipase L1-like esterase